MLTTASVTSSARSAKDSAPRGHQRRASGASVADRANDRQTDGRRPRPAAGRAPPGRAQGVHREAMATILIWSNAYRSARSVPSFKRRLRRKRGSMPQPELAHPHTIATPSDGGDDPDDPHAVARLCAASIHGAPHPSGKAANKMPSTARARPRAAMRSSMRHGYWVVRSGAPASRAGAGARLRRAATAGAVVGARAAEPPCRRVVEVAEEVRVRAQHQARIRLASGRSHRPASSGRRRRSPDPARKPRRGCGSCRRRPGRAAARPGGWPRRR